MELLTAKNHSVIINARIIDDVICAGLIIITQLSPSQLVFSDLISNYLINLPEELVDQGMTASLIDVELQFFHVNS